jgi:serine/threonine protein kinase/tetratricopeptide (TPR) repeat protein
MTDQRWQQVKAIFDRAIDCKSDARAEFIRESCRDDQELLTEVQSLLAHDGAAESLLENPLIQAGSLAALAPARTAKKVDRMVGRTIGNYIITSELARGGMGVVYRARHVALPRDVVVKCIWPIAVSAEAAEDLRKRFRREAFIQSQLDHPHIVRVYEFFDGAEEYFLVMEYVSGLSLRAMLNQRKVLSVKEACDLAAQALDGLAYAHDLCFVDESGNTGTGMIHRDIKPANMLLDEHGNLKVTDFGIAKILGNEQMTKTGFSPGTAEYMSPEQIRGLPGDARSDLYSLGVTLYEMLSGRVPFRRTTIDSDYDVLRAHIETDPAPIRTLNAAISPALADVIDGSLNKDPDQRWQSAAEFRDALLPHGSNRTPKWVSSSALPHMGGRLAKRWLRRRWLKTASIAVLALTAAATGALWFGRSGRSSGLAQDQASIAVLPFADMSPEKDQGYVSDGLAEELLNGLANTQGLRVAGRTSSFQFKGTTDGSGVIGKKLNVATILEGSVRKQGNRARIAVELVRTRDGFTLWSETFDRDMSDIFAVEQEIASAVMGELGPKLLGRKVTAPSPKSTNPEAYNAYLQGQYFFEQRNKENLEKSVDYFRQAAKLDPAYPRAWVGLAKSYYSQADAGYVPLDKGYPDAREAANRALQLDPNMGEAWAAMGWIRMHYDRNWSDADAACQRALALEPGNVTVLGAAGTLSFILGRSDDAISRVRRATQIDPLNSVAFWDLGLYSYYAGRQEEATAALKKALELAPEVAMAHGILGLVHLAQGQPQAAVDEANQERDPELRLQGLALAYFAMGRKKESDASLAELTSKFADDPFYIAEVYGFRREPDLAFEWLERSYKERDDGITEIKGDPLLKSLERDPRYAALLKKIGLPL